MHTDDLQNGNNDDDGISTGTFSVCRSNKEKEKKIIKCIRKIYASPMR
jgi:hypothetical protein